MTTVTPAPNPARDAYARWIAALDSAGWNRSTGMLPDGIPCKACGKPLNADGGHPAELYAGTYNGLCYACTKAGPYAVDVFPDGTVQLSYPPHCPSWRRDREKFYAHPDCEDCAGAGMRMVSRSNMYGGSYPVHCLTCTARVSVPRERACAQLLRDVAETLQTMPAELYPCPEWATRDIDMTGDRAETPAMISALTVALMAASSIADDYSGDPHYAPSALGIIGVSYRYTPAMRRAKNAATVGRHLARVLCSMADERDAKADASSTRRGFYR